MTITADLPSVAESDIDTDITVQDDAMTISGERKSEFEERKAKGFGASAVLGSFPRSVSLPYSIDPDKVDARFTNGVLKLVIDRPAEALQDLKTTPIRH